MYIIIAGCRKVGSNLALMLSLENHDVVVIDSDPANFEPLGSGFNGVTITGMPIDEDVLRSAGIDRADALAAVTNDDNMNVMISQIAHELFGVPTVITRLYDPEREAVFKMMGLTTICPTTLAVDRIKNLLIPQEKIGAMEIDGTGVDFHRLKPTRRMTGKSISDIKDMNVFGILKNGRFYIARPAIIVESMDTLIVSGYTEQEGEAACI